VRFPLGLGARGPEWERKEFGFWVILKADKKVAYHYTNPQLSPSGWYQRD